MNGSGKTTTIGKIANKILSNKKILIAACDTFRAAAVEAALNNNLGALNNIKDNNLADNMSLEQLSQLSTVYRDLIEPEQRNAAIEAEKIKKAKSNFSKDFKHICLGISASGPTKRWNIKNYIQVCEKINAQIPSKFYIAAGSNDKDLVNEILNSSIGKNCTSFENLKISETLPIIKNCDLYLGNDTGWLHIAAALKIKCLALFMDSPVQAYGKYSNFINVIVPEGETEETTTHDTLGSEKISFEKVLNSSVELLKKNQS